MSVLTVARESIWMISNPIANFKALPLLVQSLPNVPSQMDFIVGLRRDCA